MCATEFKQLDIVLREHRIKTLIRIERQGIYHYYNNDQLNWLTFNNQGRRDVHMKWNCTSYEHAGWFRHCPPIEKIINGFKMKFFERLDMEAKSLYAKRLYKKLEAHEAIRELDKEEEVKSNADAGSTDREGTGGSPENTDEGRDRIGDNENAVGEKTNESNEGIENA